MARTVPTLVAAAAFVALAAGCSGGLTTPAGAPTTAPTAASSIPASTAAEPVATTPEPEIPLPELARPPARCRDPRPTLLVVGDSVLQGAGPVLEDLLDDRFVVTYDALRDRATPRATRIVASTPPADRQVVVVGTGHNDGPDTAEFEEWATDLLAETAGSDVVMWMTLPDARRHYPAVNEVLAELAGERDDLHLIEWGPLADGDDELTIRDGIHLTEAGAEALADLVMGRLEAWLDAVPVCGRTN